MYNFLNIYKYFFYPSQFGVAFWSREDHPSSMPHSWAAQTMKTLSLFRRCGYRHQCHRYFSDLLPWTKIVWEPFFSCKWSLRNIATSWSWQGNSFACLCGTWMTVSSIILWCHSTVQGHLSWSEMTVSCIWERLAMVNGAKPTTVGARRRTATTECRSHAEERRALLASLWSRLGRAKLERGDALLVAGSLRSRIINGTAPGKLWEHFPFNFIK